MPPAASATTPRQAQLCLLSNGRYSVMLDRHGSGFSRWQDASVFRWRVDPVTDTWGSYLLLRDEDDGSTCSATTQPYGDDAPEDRVQFTPGQATFERRLGKLHSTLEVAVAADQDIELRRLTLSNHGDETRTLSLTTYAELVLGPRGGDDAHPAYSKMFVQTEWDASARMLLATRRLRDDNQPQVWAAQALRRADAPSTVEPEYETDRACFLGRCRTLRQAQAMRPGARLGDSVGCVLDPIFSQRQHFTLAAGASVTFELWTQLADSRDGALTLSHTLHDADAADKVFAGATARAQATCQRLHLDEDQRASFAHWLKALLLGDATQQAAPDARAKGRGGAPTLWAAGISGDRPIALLTVDHADVLPQLQTLLRAQRYWRGQCLGMDVVVLNRADGEAGDALQQRLDALIDPAKEALKADPDAVKAELFALRAGALSDELKHGLYTVAALLVGGDAPPPAAAATPADAAAPRVASTPARPPRSLPDATEFANGSGAFVDGGRSYQIELAERDATPAPWVNVMANPGFGCMVSADGGGYAWALNSQQNPLTPWPNDPVSDTPHEVLYLRDEDDGTLWSATALPIRVPGAHYRATHGKGWSRFDSDAHALELELTVCVPSGDSIKLSRLRLCNRSERTRSLSLTGYVEWALGPNGTTPAPFVVTTRDEKTGALLARNHWRPDFGERVAFIDLAAAQHSMTGDRRGFLGALGDVSQPAALTEATPLAGMLGAGFDPCGALQTHVQLPPNTEIELVFSLGDAADLGAAQALIEKYRAASFDAVLDDIAAQWADVLDTVQVRTPDRAMDILLNDWLLYQVISCRLWARTAYYQASGAYGFRDQLQDVMALCVSRPDLAREQLLRAAGRQFPEGDVQHWWLPPSGQGVRTDIRDDRLWLPFVAMHYVTTTGDQSVLGEVLPFLISQPIPDGASDAFFTPTLSDETASVYEHAARSVDVSLTRGAHGLPLIGTGDWNDGMNSVGEKGRGESSWLAWFTLATIDALAPCAEQRGDTERARRWRAYATEQRAALEQAWDGQWYRRGYYDDGTPLGSHACDECHIDTIAQSWSVIAGIGQREHAAQSMASVDRILVDHEHQVARLFTPPFDHGDKNPGYIKGYPPGVRENGGQYTHGAIWSVFAWAGLGDGDRAGGMFDLLNPIHHSDSAEAVARYKVEPYVACADVYSVAPHIGRGGWTWYTGSAAWLYRAGLEAVLGFHLQGDQLRVDPCLPKHWPGFELTYQHRGAQHVTRYEISVANPNHVCRGVTHIDMDGQTLASDEAVKLVDDGRTRQLKLTLG